MSWYFSVAFGLCGLLAGLLRVGLAIVFEAGASRVEAEVAGLLTLMLGGFLIGGIVDIGFRVRRRRKGRKRPGGGAS